MTIEQFKNNWQPKMIDSYYARFCFNLDLKELVQQTRVEVIDECKKIATADCTSSCEYPFQPDCIECMCNKFNKLKEQDNEQYLCPEGYDKRKVSCDNCEIPFCDYR